MSDPAAGRGRIWKLRRLRAMAPPEIWHRARVALRDGWRPPPYAAWPPARAGRELFAGGAKEALGGSRLAQLTAAHGWGPEFAAEIAAARALLAGRWTLFGREVHLSDPPRWNGNPLTGQTWPDLPSARLDYRRADVAGGVRYVWELGG